MAENNATEAQEPIKKAKAYKITSKAFEKRSEAAGEAAEAKIKGIAPVLVIEGGGYVQVVLYDGANKGSSGKTVKNN